MGSFPEANARRIKWLKYSNIIVSETISILFPSAHFNLQNCEVQSTRCMFGVERSHAKNGPSEVVIWFVKQNNVPVRRWQGRRRDLSPLPKTSCPHGAYRYR